MKLKTNPERFSIFIRKLLFFKCMTVAICINVSIYETNKLYQNATKKSINLNRIENLEQMGNYFMAANFSMIFYSFIQKQLNFSIANKCTIKISVVNL